MFISSDTNIWIDFQEIGHLNHPFRLSFQYYISSDTFRDEFLKPATMRSELLDLGLQITVVTNEEYIEAMALQERYKELSLYDGFALAIAKLRGWTLLTGDMPLRKAAAKEKVEVHGTIWVYDQLKQQGKMTDDEYASVIDELITAVRNGRCRLPFAELDKRKNL